jgi:hypothetical protein
MAITFTNIWKDKIMDKLSSILRDEFGGQIPVYISDGYVNSGNCSIRIFGKSQTSIEFTTDSFTNEYQVEMAYYLVATNSNETILDKLYRDISRIEQLIANNLNISDYWHNALIDSIEINSYDEIEDSVDGLLTAKLNFVCSYTKVS